LSGVISSFAAHVFEFVAETPDANQVLASIIKAGGEVHELNSTEGPGQSEVIYPLNARRVKPYCAPSLTSLCLKNILILDRRGIGRHLWVYGCIESKLKS
jgi:hypothetical protein